MALDPITILLVPVIVASTLPKISIIGELISPITKPIEYSLNGTYDPENDSLTCSWNWLGKTQNISNCVNGTGYISFANETISTFDLTLLVSDGVNPDSQYLIPVELYNEMPNASFDIERKTLFLENVKENGTLTIYTIEGALLKRISINGKSSYSLSLNDLQLGIYIAQVVLDNVKINYKFVTY